jgi:cell division protein FtsI/penicillin-binding protein 2
MKFRSYFLLFVLLFVSSVPACNPAPAASKGSPTAPIAATRTLAKVEPTIIKAPNAELTAQVFLNAWKVEDYPTMYSLLTSASQDALTQEKFVQRYKDAAVNMTLQKLEYKILSKLTNPTRAEVAYQVIFHTQMIGDLNREMTMNMSMEKGTWRVQWDDGLILPDLHGGNVLVMDLKSPTRGNIYDRNGNAVAVANDIFALGIVKGDMQNEGVLLSELSKLTGKDPEAIRALYSRDSVYKGDYVPVGEASRDAVLARYDVLSGLYTDGLRMTEYTGRFYADGGIAPHVTGYVQAIPVEEKDKYLREGFRLDDRVGKAGLELWAENYLIGQRGASLYVTDPQGSPVTRLAQVESKPSQSVYMTIDSKLQLEAQQAITGFSGAIVVMERDTGRVLALVSSPGFDPNAFEYQNYNSGPLLGSITGDGLKRLYNRASGNGYPLGSVFKVITMAAALESGLFQASDTLNCQWDWTEIPGVTKTDWTKDKGLPPSGILNLQEGLMRSCNPWFYHIGYTLYKEGHEKDISNMARAFGLGSKTGIDYLDFDETGNIPDSVDEESAALIAIGQDKVLVNPLQVARFMAAVGNGGTLYRPQVIEKVTDPDGKASFTFKPEEQGKLPVKEENLKLIQEAMRWVVNSKRGTAVRAFSGFGIPVYAKTGTAQNDFPGHPHAWFAGYTDAATGKPDIAFAVIAEYAGEGSDIAAPIARRLLEVYFLGQAQRVYPWESRINVTRTPTPLVTDTPAPGN